MYAQDVFAIIPLLISFPTILLSSNYIIQYSNIHSSDEISPIIKHSNGHTHSYNNIDTNSLSFYQIITNLLLLPCFISSCFTLILYYFNIISLSTSIFNSNNKNNNNDDYNNNDNNNNDNNKLFSIFTFGFILCQCNWIFKPIITACYCLITLRQLFAINIIDNDMDMDDDIKINNKNNTMSIFIAFLKKYLPLIVLNFFIDYINQQNNLLIFTSIKCILLILLRFIENYTTTLKVSQRTIFFLLFGSFGLIHLLSSASILSLFNDIQSSFEIQYLMIFIFIACSSLFALSLNDIISNNINDHIQKYNNNNNNNNNNTFGIKNNFILIVGFMTIIIQYLSFNSINLNRLTDFSTIIFVILSEFISRNNNNNNNNNTNNSHDSKSNEKIKSLGINSNCNTLDSNTNNKSLLRKIVTNKDTRSIFSFLLLNSTFMLVQLLYSFRSKSLGLLSDSLHMALDCTSLLLGLIAKILSKNPSNDKYPFALNYLESLAGFTNGVLLLGIVAGIFIQAIERLFNPVHIHGTNELIVVSTLGLLVNLIGLFVFETGNHGNSDKNQNHNHQHSTTNGHDHDHDHSHSIPPQHDLQNSSEDENMKGIFLHILADTLGSVGVVISTLLIKLTGWHIFDPIASLLIGILILISSMPLLKATTESMLLKLNNKKHNIVKLALNEIIQTPGITGYTTPRFWPYNPENIASGHSHGHTHSHTESHAEEDERQQHDHDHDHDHSHGHSHAHSHGHDTKQVTKKKETLVGYIHVQYVEGENSTIIKKRVEKIFENLAIKAWIQVEPQNGSCWCRAASMSNQIMTQRTNR